MKIPSFTMARGGSKRIPRKNVKDFHGKPLLAWALLPAIESTLVDDSFVITDDEEIAKIGSDYGARILWQPTEMCEYGHWGGPITHCWAIQELEDMGYEFNYHVTIPATGIWNTANDIDGAIMLATKHNANIIEACVERTKAWFSVTHSRSPGGPVVQWLERYDDAVEGFIYYHTGGFGVCKKTAILDMRQSFLDDNRRLLPEIADGTADIHDPKYGAVEIDCPNSLPWVMPWYVQFDINTPEDWIIAEKIFGEVMLK